MESNQEGSVESVLASDGHPGTADETVEPATKKLRGKLTSVSENIKSEDVAKSSSPWLTRLEKRLSTVLCCTVCLDLPVRAIYQPDQGAISGSFDGELRLWSLISGDCKRFPTTHSCSIIAIVCTGTCIVSLDVSELLCIWDQPTRNCLHRLPQLPGGCHDFTLMSTNLAVCVGRGTIVVLDLTSGQILRIVELEQKNDHILMNHVMKPCQDTVVCDYGERLVLLTFLEIIDKLE